MVQAEGLNRAIVSLHWEEAISAQQIVAGEPSCDIQLFMLLNLTMLSLSVSAAK